ncbi:unnamed protein product [Rotaria magnacalcarata]|nr:unnamed protein product [Rotaria magnacalcarata]
MIRLDDQHITDNPTALTSLLIQSTTINLSTEAITTLLELAEITEPSTVETSPSEAAITALEVAETTGSSIVETLSTGVTRAASELVDSTVVSNTATSLIITTIIVGDQCKTSAKYNIHFKNNTMTLVFTEDETTNTGRSRARNLRHSSRNHRYYSSENGVKWWQKV